MKKWLLGFLVGGFLGIFDGLTAPLPSSATVRITCPRARLTSTMIGEAMFGRMCRRTIVNDEHPTVRAASTNSRSFVAIVGARAMRAMRGA